MEKLINRLICLVRGHKWYIQGITDKIGNDDGVILINRCSRCGKTEGIEVL